MDSFDSLFSQDPNQLDSSLPGLGDPSFAGSFDPLTDPFLAGPSDAFGVDPYAVDPYAVDPALANLSPADTQSLIDYNVSSAETTMANSDANFQAMDNIITGG